ncbi:MAG: hypothetical protein ACXW4B_11680 [Micavibrio sp.]
MKKKKQKLLGIRLSAPFQERERKLNVSSAAQLERIHNHVIRDPHYATLNDLRFVQDWLQDLKLRVPQEDSGLRYRLYYDDPKLTATKSGVEIRLEYRGDKTADGWPYKQVIKVGAAGSDDNHTLDRLEYPAKLRQGMPVLRAVRGDGAAFLKAAFNKANLADIDLYPMIQIASQRWKLLYHPDGDPDTQIELATDLARARTFTGFSWDLFQVEMEMKKGDPAILGAEVTRLLSAFNGAGVNDLRIEKRSKPSPGFDVLAPLLAEKEARDFVRHNLMGGHFAVFPGFQA